MKGLLTGYVFLLVLATSCSYIAGEAAANYTASEGHTLTYVENRPLSSTLTGHTAALGAGMILDSIAAMWEARDKIINRRKLAFDCMMKGGKEDECKIQASHRERIKKIFFLSLHTGKCTKSWWNPFSAFNKCYEEALSDLESLTTGKSLEEAVYQVYYDHKMMECMPDPLEYRTNTEKLVRIYTECRKEAEEFASKELQEMEKHIKEYRNRQEQASM